MGNLWTGMKLATMVMGVMAAVQGGNAEAQQQVWRFDEFTIGGAPYPDVEFKILIYYWDPTIGDIGGWALDGEFEYDYVGPVMEGGVQFFVWEFQHDVSGLGPNDQVYGDIIQRYNGGSWTPYGTAYPEWIP